ncbi:hypothetical protein [Vreelandella jeotgali]|nr:hypothetical protein [Halomonas jeotgali]
MHKIILVIITSIAIAGCVGAGQNLPEKETSIILKQLAQAMKNME